MKTWLKILILTIFAVGFATGTVYLSLYSKSLRAETGCTKLEILFADSLRFVGKGDVSSLIEENYGVCIGERLSEVRLAEIESILESQSAISRCEAWTTDDGVLHVEISQRQPVLRFDRMGTGFYVDGDGYIFPLHKSFTAEVPVVTGNIPVNVEADYRGEAPTEAERRWILGVLDLERTINVQKSWRGKFSGVEVNADGDIILRPADGGEMFVFGEPREIAEKLERIGKYYSYILPEYGKGHYKEVNIKYSRQIICRKDI